MTKLEQHHVKYKEIHGEDEIIMLSHAEHRQLHAELRANGAESVPDWIARAAERRSPAGKSTRAKYARSEKCKADMTAYRQTEAGKAARDAGNAKYRKTKKGRAADIAAKTKYRAKQKELRT